MVWFALADERSLFASLASDTFNGDRGTKSKPVPGLHQVYGFLTTAPNAMVEPIHPKAMPVILTPTKSGTRNRDEAKALQRPLDRAQDVMRGAEKRRRGGR
jgi:putative SOS response-associated peptidase YedK